MNAKNPKFLVLVDDDHINKIINLSIIKSLSIVQETVVCQNGMEAWNYILQYINVDVKSPEIILIDLKKSTSRQNSFLDVFNFLNKSKENSERFVVLYTPHFFEDLQLLGLKGFNLVEKSYKFKNNIIPEFYDENLISITFPGYEIIGKPLKDLENDETTTSIL